MKHFTAHTLHRAGRSMTIKVVVVLAAITAAMVAGLQSASATVATVYPPVQPSTSVVSRTGASSTDPIVTRALASTGSDVTTMINIAAALLILGVLGLYLARRRAH